MRTSASFTATGLHNGTKYWFVVTGVDRGGNQSRASASVGAVPADTTAPRPPTDLDVDTYPEENALTWAPSQDDVVGDVVGYHVHRSLSATGPWTRLTTAPVAMNLFHDAKAPIGVRAYYRVTAVDEAKNESTPASAGGTRPDDGSVTPPVPTGLKATATTDGITLGWGDNPAGSGTHGYNVYRSTAAAGTYTRLTATPITAPQYQDSQAPVGSVAYYRVTAVSKPDIFGVRHESAPAQTSATRPVPPDTTPPPAPAGAQAVLDYAKTQVSVRWNPATDTDTVRFELRRYLKDGTVQQVTLSSPLFAGYADRAPDVASVDSYLISAFDAAGNRSDTRVYVRWDSDAPPAAPTGLTPTPVTATAFTDPAGRTAPRWYYAVVTVDGSGTRSLPATVRQDIDLQAPPVPSRLSAALHTPPGYLELQWDNAVAPGSDTVGYLVHWSGALGGPYTPLTPGPLVPTGPYGTFRIDSPPAGWSFFRVIAVDAVGNQSAPATAQSYR